MAGSIEASCWRCELVLFLLSPAWAASKWCLAEFLLAKSLNKRIFAAIVAPTLYTELPSEMTTEWQLIDLTAGPRDYCASVTMSPSNTVEAVSFGTDGLNRLRIGLLQAGLDANYFEWPPKCDLARPPYRGLKPFEAEDAGIFFGRDGAIVEILDRLRGLREASPPRLLVILGASGAGKSSFLRAGVLPRLARDDQHFLCLPIIRPERAAVNGETGLVASLSGVLVPAGVARTRREVRNAVKGGIEALQPLLDKYTKHVQVQAFDNTIGVSKPPTLVLPIDQAEELFMSEGAQEGLGLLSLLRDMILSESPALITLITIRSDHYERLQTERSLEGLRQNTFSLPPMPSGAYSEVIRGPAQRLAATPRKLRIDDLLVDRLLRDIGAGDAKDALPLLAFTLERLYLEFGGDGYLRLDDYERFGGLAGSIEAAVERTFIAADQDGRIPRDHKSQLKLLRQGMIPWLAGIDPDTAAPRRRIARLSEIPPESRPMIDLLVEQRLLATDSAKETGATTIEPAHEALLRQWSSLRDWLKQDAILLTVLDGVKGAVGDWDKNGRKSSWLAHAGERLDMAEKLLLRTDLATQLNSCDKEYIRCCVKLRNRNRTLADVFKFFCAWSWNHYHCCCAGF